MSGFERHARTVSLFTLGSRVTGLLRDATLSRMFGAGAIMDAFFLAFMVPNLFRRLFGEGALSAAFLPVYARLEQEDPAMARRVASALVTALVVVLGAIVAVLELVILLTVTPDGPATLTMRLALIMLPYMPLVCAVAVLGAVLQVHGRFGPTAAAPVLLNGAIVVAALGALVIHQGAPQRITIVAIAVLVAGVIQVAWTLHALRDLDWWTRAREGTGPQLRRIMRQAGPMIVGLGVLQVNTLIDGLIAGWPAVFGPTILGVPYPLSEGAMATVSFAQRLYQFPLGVFGIAIATAIFPLLAKQAPDGEAFAGTLRRGLRLVMFIGLPASIGLIVVREPLAATVLAGGDFGRGDAARVGFVLLGYAPAIWAYSMTHVLARAFYARGDAMTPVRIAAAVVGLNLLLNVTLIWTPLREAGLAWSTSVCAVVQSVLLSVTLRRRTRALIDRGVLGSWARTLGAALLCGAAAALALSRVQPGASWSASAGALALSVAAGALTYAAAARVMRMAELRWALRGAPEQSPGPKA